MTRLHLCFYAAASSLLSVVGIVKATTFDPIKNMCVRYDHQSTVKNNKLYVDGGTQTFVPAVNGSQQTGNITIGYNSVLIEIDLTESWDWKTNITEKYYNKSGIANVQSIPVLSRGALYQGAASDNNIFLYGGTTSYINTSDIAYEPPTSAQYSLYSFDTISKNVAQFNISAASPFRPSSGAYAEAPDQGLAFYLEGEIDSGSSTETQVLGDSHKFYLQGMIVIDTETKIARNVSTTAVGDGQPRTYGSLQYIPGVGPSGILVHLGGSDYNGNLSPLDSVSLFNVNSLYDDTVGTWIHQPTRGDIPVARVSTCVLVASASDGSSHNIYMYGGRGSGNQYFDQVFVLSIPSFTWIKLYEGNNSRFAHTCHLVGNRQMLTVGGITNNPLKTGPCDYQTKGVNILDLSTVTWGSVYDAHAPPYAVPSLVAATIGGSGAGGSNISYPQGLNEFFTSNKTSTAYQFQSPSKLGIGAIAGAVIGSIAGAILACGGLWILFIRNRRRHREEAETPPTPPEKDLRPVPPEKMYELHVQRQFTELPSTGRSRVEMEALRGVKMYQHSVEVSPL